MKINGNHMKLETPTMLSEIIVSQGYSDNRIAVELNGDIIPRSEYRETEIRDSDILEIVGMVGGG